jgi:hypothetical protein
LMLIYLEKHLENEMATKRRVNTLLRLWLATIADHHFRAIRVLGKRGDCRASRGAGKIFRPWAVEARKVVAILKTAVHWLVKLRLTQIGLAATLPEIGDLALRLGELAGDEVHLLPHHVECSLILDIH